MQVRRRRQTQQSSRYEQQESISRDLGGNSDQRLSIPSIDQFVRAIGGGNGQGGPSIIGQLMRSPVVENLVQGVMQGVGDVNGDGDSRLGPPPSGLDLSGMLHHVVPLVTQMLNGGSAPVFPGSTAGTSARTSIDGTARTTGSWEPEPENWQDALTEVRKSCHDTCLPYGIGHLVHVIVNPHRLQIIGFPLTLSLLSNFPSTHSHGFT